MPPHDLAGKPSELRRRVWASMRMSPGGFRITQLAELAAVARKRVERYVNALQRGGYVEIVGTPKHGWQGQTYRLVRDTGPIAPRVERSVLLDPNIVIAEERTRRARLLAELRRCDQRLRALGAYVERLGYETDAGSTPGSRDQ